TVTGVQTCALPIFLCALCVLCGWRRLDLSLQPEEAKEIVGCDFADLVAALAPQLGDLFCRLCYKCRLVPLASIRNWSQEWRVGLNEHTVLWNGACYV